VAGITVAGALLGKIDQLLFGRIAWKGMGACPGSGAQRLGAALNTGGVKNEVRGCAFCGAAFEGTSVIKRAGACWPRGDCIQNGLGCAMGVAG